MTDTENKRLTFLLGDDHIIVRQGIAIMIEDMVEDAVIHHATTLEQIVDCVKSNQIDIAILDAQYSSGNCLSILGELKTISPDIKILIFTSFDEEMYSLKFIKEGADGYLNKQSDEEQIKEALESMIENGEYYPPFTKRMRELSIANPDILNPLSQLSEREIQIAELYARGYGNLEIAIELSVKQNTVSTYKKRIFEKLKIETLVELIDLMKIHHNL
jgi:DNA-binding NarL/FixJ family response regulator